MLPRLVLALTLVALLPLPVLAADEAGGEQAGLMEFRIPTYVWSLLTFLIALSILYKFAWGPLIKALDDREKRIKESLMAADLAREETQRLHDEHQKLMADARKEATAIVEEGKRDATVVKEQIVDDAKKEAESMTTRAKAEIQRAKDLAIEDIHARSVDLSYAIAEKLIRKSLTPDDHRELVNATIQDYARTGVGSGS